MIRPLTEVNGHYYGLFQLLSVNVCFDSLRFIFDPERDLTIGCFPLFAYLVHNSVQTKGGRSIVTAV